MSRRKQFPLGARVTPEALSRDLYAILAELREHEPVSWIESLNMWYVTRYEDVCRVLLDAAGYTTAFDRSPVQDTFGSQMLTSEGAQHDRYRRAVQTDFSAQRVRVSLETTVERLVDALIDSLAAAGTAELRSGFAARLPIQTILRMCGLPLEAEPRIRVWYDHFESALANFTAEPAIREAAGTSVAEFHAFLQQSIDATPSGPGQSLLARLVRADDAHRLSDDEIKRNLSIIFFGGVSTVEALILNCLWALAEHPDVMSEVCRDSSMIGDVVEETIRWRSPVQSATRHARRAARLHEAEILEGEVVNCMLGAANRDPTLFPHPDLFQVRRPNVRRHLGFAMGPHACLGLNLARLEARTALSGLLARLPAFHIVAHLTDAPAGYEFHQPRRLQASWKL